MAGKEKYAVLDYMQNRTMAVCSTLTGARRWIKNRRFLDDYSVYTIMRGTSALDWVEVEVKG